MSFEPFSPYTLTDDITLQHRIVMAPLTRNRGTQSSVDKRTYVPNELMAEYYGQRATKGGLIISEATPVSLVASCLPGVPGLSSDEQIAGWKKITDAVHAKDGYMFSQLWHQGRNADPRYSGLKTVSSSAVPITDNEKSWRGMPPEPFDTPEALTIDGIKETQHDFVRCATNAIAAGFDGIELHAANGYLFDQFHHDNINQRTDNYGGSIENRCRFTLETAKMVAAAIGSKKVGVRLAPFGYFNQTRGNQRISQWKYLCAELDKLDLAYIHLIEPRFDEYASEEEKLKSLNKVSELANITPSLEPFKDVINHTTIMVAGGYTRENLEEATPKTHLIAMGRYFCSNGDLVDRLKNNEKLYHYDRSTFYGPFDKNEIGYTVHPSQEGKEPTD